MNDQADVAVHVGGKLAEGSYDGVLLHEAICPLRPSHAHHKLKVIDDDMSDVVDINRMGHGLTGQQAVSKDWEDIIDRTFYETPSLTN